MKSNLTAVIVLWPVAAFGQGLGLWEQPFDFGPSFEDTISAIH